MSVGSQTGKPVVLSHRILRGIGRKVPQEAPDAFARAITDVGT